MNTERYIHAGRPSLCQAATFAYEEELSLRDGRSRAENEGNLAAVSVTSDGASDRTPLHPQDNPLPHPKSAIYIASISKAAKLFALFAKRAPISGQLAVGIAPCRRVDVFEIFALLSTVCRGSIQAKAQLLFDVFDVDRTHDISEDELALLIISVNSALAKLRLVDYITFDDVDYAVSLAFMDGHGKTRHHFSPVEFQVWARSHDTPLGMLGPLSLLARLQNVIDLIKTRTKKISALISFDNSSDKVLQRFLRGQVRTNTNVYTTLGPVVGKVGCGGCTVLIEVTGTVESILFVMKSGLPKSKNVVHRQKVMLVGNIPSLITLPEGLLEQGCEYKLVFTGFGPGSDSPTAIVKIPPMNSVISVISYASDLESHYPENLFDTIAGSTLIIRMEDLPVRDPGVVQHCLMKLESELSLIDFEADDDGDCWTEEILDSLDMHYAEAIRAVYRTKLKQGGWEITRGIPVLVFGSVDVWLGFDPRKARREYPKAAAFMSGILEIIRREYIESLWGERSILVALNEALEGDDQDNLLTLRGGEGTEGEDDDSVVGKPSGGIDLGTTKVLCLEAPSAFDIIEEFDLMTDVVDEKTKKARPKSFDGKVNFTERQWRKIRRVLKQEDPNSSSVMSSQNSSHGFAMGDDADHKNVVFVVSFPIIYNAKISNMEDSFVDSLAGNRLSTIVSVTDSDELGSLGLSSTDAVGTSERDTDNTTDNNAVTEDDESESRNNKDSHSNADADGASDNVSRDKDKTASSGDSALVSVMSEASGSPSLLHDGNDEELSLLSRRNSELQGVSTDMDDNEGGEEQSAGVKYPQLMAIPVPISKGFVLQGLTKDTGDSDGRESGFGRDDPPWISGEGGLSGGAAKSPRRKNGGSGTAEDDDDGEASRTPEKKPASPPGSIPQIKDAGGSPEENVSILVNGKEIGRVTESVITGNMLQDLLNEEAENKGKKIQDSAVASNSLQNLLFEKSQEEQEVEEGEKKEEEDLSKVTCVWPDKRPSLHLQLAKAQFLCGESANVLQTLRVASDIAKEHEPGTTAIDSWSYRTLLSNVTNTLQRGSDTLDFQISCPIEEIIDSFFPEPEGHEQQSIDSEATDNSYPAFAAFPLPSHIKSRLKWKQLKVAVLGYAFQTSLEQLYEAGDSDCLLIQRVGLLAYYMGNRWGFMQGKLYRLASVLLQKSYNMQHFEQPQTDKRAMLGVLGRSHFLAWRSQGVAADKAHLSYSRVAYDLLMGGDGEAAPLAHHFFEYSETLSSMDKKQQAIQTLMQMLGSQTDGDEAVALAEFRLATLLHRCVRALKERGTRTTLIISCFKKIQLTREFASYAHNQTHPNTIKHNLTQPNTQGIPV